MSVPLSDVQRLDWLHLIRCENVGPRTFRALLTRYGGAGPALAALPELMRRSGPGGRTLKLLPRQDAEREMEAAQKAGVRFIGWDAPDYPPLLAQTDDAPPLIAVTGNMGALARPMVAIVGSRNASAAGLAFTERLARGLAREGFVIVSGLARGIDERAHRATLRSGTVAVLAGSHDRIYPPEHAALAQELMEDGALVSEMPLGWEPRGRDFPRRNRIVASLAQATIVVEAARRSGSLITARFAAERGREVLAVPGSPLDPRAEGTNDLIRDGASLCAGVDDVLRALQASGGRGMASFQETQSEEPLWDEWIDAATATGSPPAPAPVSSPSRETAPPPARPDAREAAPADLEATILGLLGPSPAALDDLVRISGAPAGAVRTVLFDLELAGRIALERGGLVSLRPKAD